MAATIENETGEMIVKRVSVPIGLEELMEGLAKEVLLKKPNDLYVFASEYFTKLLEMKQKGNYKTKPLKAIQSITRQSPLTKKPAPVRQLSRQLSIRGESPPKIQKPPLNKKDEKQQNKAKRILETKRKARQIAEDKESIKISPVKIQQGTPREPLKSLKNEKESPRDKSKSRTSRSDVKSQQSTPRDTSRSVTRSIKGSGDSKATKKTKESPKKQVTDVKNDKKDIGKTALVVEAGKGIAKVVNRNVDMTNEVPQGIANTDINKMKEEITAIDGGAKKLLILPQKGELESELKNDNLQSKEKQAIDEENMENNSKLGDSNEEMLNQIKETQELGKELTKTEGIDEVDKDEDINLATKRQEKFAAEEGNKEKETHELNNKSIKSEDADVIDTDEDAKVSRKSEEKIAIDEESNEKHTKLEESNEEIANQVKEAREVGKELAKTEGTEEVDKDGNIKLPTKSEEKLATEEDNKRKETHEHNKSIKSEDADVIEKTEAAKVLSKSEEKIATDEESTEKHTKLEESNEEIANQIKEAQEVDKNIIKNKGTEKLDKNEDVKSLTKCEEKIITEDDNNEKQTKLDELNEEIASKGKEVIEVNNKLGKSEDASVMDKNADTNVCTQSEDKLNTDAKNNEQHTKFEESNENISNKINKSQEADKKPIIKSEDTDDLEKNEGVEISTKNEDNLEIIEVNNEKHTTLKEVNEEISNKINQEENGKMPSKIEGIDETDKNEDIKIPTKNEDKLESNEVSNENHTKLNELQAKETNVIYRSVKSEDTDVLDKREDRKLIDEREDNKLHNKSEDKFATDKKSNEKHAKLEESNEESANKISEMREGDKTPINSEDKVEVDKNEELKTHTQSANKLSIGEEKHSTLETAGEENDNKQKEAEKEEKLNKSVDSGVIEKKEHIEEKYSVSKSVELQINDENKEKHSNLDILKDEIKQTQEVNQKLMKSEDADVADDKEKVKSNLEDSKTKDVHISDDEKIRAETKHRNIGVANKSIELDDEQTDKKEKVDKSEENIDTNSKLELSNEELESEIKEAQDADKKDITSDKTDAIENKDGADNKLLKDEIPQLENKMNKQDTLAEAKLSDDSQKLVGKKYLPEESSSTEKKSENLDSKDKSFTKQNMSEVSLGAQKSEIEETSKESGKKIVDTGSVNEEKEGDIAKNSFHNKNDIVERETPKNEEREIRTTGKKHEINKITNETGQDLISNQEDIIEKKLDSKKHETDTPLDNLSNKNYPNESSKAEIKEEEFAKENSIEKNIAASNEENNKTFLNDITKEETLEGLIDKGSDKLNKDATQNSQDLVINTDANNAKNEAIQSEIAKIKETDSKIEEKLNVTKPNSNEDTSTNDGAKEETQKQNTDDFNNGKSKTKPETKDEQKESIGGEENLKKLENAISGDEKSKKEVETTDSKYLNDLDDKSHENQIKREEKPLESSINFKSKELLTSEKDDSLKNESTVNEIQGKDKEIHKEENMAADSNNQKNTSPLDNKEQKDTHEKMPKEESTEDVSNKKAEPDLKKDNASENEKMEDTPSSEGIKSDIHYLSEKINQEKKDIQEKTDTVIDKPSQGLNESNLHQEENNLNTNETSEEKGKVPKEDNKFNSFKNESTAIEEKVNNEMMNEKDKEILISDKIPNKVSQQFETSEEKHIEDSTPTQIIDSKETVNHVNEDLSSTNNHLKIEDTLVGKEKIKSNKKIILEESKTDVRNEDAEQKINNGGKLDKMAVTSNEDYRDTSEQATDYKTKDVKVPENQYEILNGEKEEKYPKKSVEDQLNKSDDLLDQDISYNGEKSDNGAEHLKKVGSVLNEEGKTENEEQKISQTEETKNDTDGDVHKNKPIDKDGKFHQNVEIPIEESVSKNEEGSPEKPENTKKSDELQHIRNKRSTDDSNTDVSESVGKTNSIVADSSMSSRYIVKSDENKDEALNDEKSLENNENQRAENDQRTFSNTVSEEHGSINELQDDLQSGGEEKDAKQTQAKKEDTQKVENSKESLNIPCKEDDSEESSKVLEQQSKKKDSKIKTDKSDSPKLTSSETSKINNIVPSESLTKKEQIEDSKSPIEETIIKSEITNTSTDAKSLESGNIEGNVDKVDIKPNEDIEAPKEDLQPTDKSKINDFKNSDEKNKIKTERSVSFPEKKVAESVIQNIITSAISALEPGKLDQDVKNHLNDFLTQEQNNVFIKAHPQGTQESMDVHSRTKRSIELNETPKGKNENKIEKEDLKENKESVQEHIEQKENSTVQQNQENKDKNKISTTNEETASKNASPSIEDKINESLKTHNVVSETSDNNIKVELTRHDSPDSSSSISRKSELFPKSEDEIISDILLSAEKEDSENSERQSSVDNYLSKTSEELTSSLHEESSKNEDMEGKAEKLEERSESTNSKGLSKENTFLIEDNKSKFKDKIEENPTFLDSNLVKNIISSSMSVINPGQIDDSVKNHLNDFLKEEQQNVFASSKTENSRKEENSTEDKDSKSDIHDQNQTSKEMQKLKHHKTRAMTSDAILANQNAEKLKLREDKPLKRSNSVETVNKKDKSRIPTAEKHESIEKKKKSLSKSTISEPSAEEIKSLPPKTHKLEKNKSVSNMEDLEIPEKRPKSIKRPKRSMTIDESQKNVPIVQMKNTMFSSDSSNEDISANLRLKPEFGREIKSAVEIFGEKSEDSSSALDTSSNKDTEKMPSEEISFKNDSKEEKADSDTKYQESNENIENIPEESDLSQPKQIEDLEIKSNQTSNEEILRKSQEKSTEKPKLNGIIKDSSLDEKRSISSENSNEDSLNSLLKAATTIQKIWRGFKVRKYLTRGDIFGKTVKSEKHDVEKLKNDHDRSAVKIQSAWRGYHARKQFGDKQWLSSIAEESSEKTEEPKHETRSAGSLKGKRSILKQHSMMVYSKENSPESSQDTTQQNNPHTLTEQEVSKALEKLEEFPVPSRSPSPQENVSDKPSFYRSKTVEEPLAVKKNVGHLIEKSTSLRETEIDRNNNDANNASDKSKEEKHITPLEKEVKDKIEEIMKNQHKGRSSSAQQHESSGEERPQSIDSTDSAVTVIYNPKEENVSDSDLDALSSSIKKHEELIEQVKNKLQEEKQNLKEDKTKIHKRETIKEDNITNSIKERVDLIDQVQNNLLDQISGNAGSKYDVDKLRKEFEEAAIMYKNENKDQKVENDEHDQLLDYLSDFEPEDRSETPKRELPDIQEEEEEKKTDENGDNFSGECPTSNHSQKNVDGIPLKDLGETIDKKPPTLKETAKNTTAKSSDSSTDHDNIKIDKHSNINPVTSLDIKPKEDTSKDKTIVVPLNIVNTLLTPEEVISSPPPKVSSSNTSADALVIPIHHKNSSNEEDTKFVVSISPKVKKEGSLDDKGAVVVSLETPNEEKQEEGVASNEDKKDQAGVVDSSNQTNVQLTDNSSGDAPVTPPPPSAGPGSARRPRPARTAADADVPRAAPRPQSSDPARAPDTLHSIQQAMDRKQGTDRAAEQAATKIQAGFRGYQVRKQLKLKNGSTDIIAPPTKPKRQLRRKNSEKSKENKTPEKNIEEQSAVKIQAGIRGFLVRRRQKKQKTEA